MCSLVMMRKIETKSVVSARKHQFCSLFVAKNTKVFQYSNFEKVVVRLKFSLQSNRQLSWSQMCDLQQFKLLIPFLENESKDSSIFSVVHFVFWFINTAAASSCNLRCVTCNFSSFSSPFQTEEAKKVQSPCLYS